MSGDKFESQRDDLGLVAGRKPVREYLLASPEKVEALFLRKGLQGRDVEKMIAQCKARDIKYKFLSAPEMDKLFPGNHQGALLETASGRYVELPALFAALDEAPLPVILALDQVQDPGNLGTLARTLYGLGGGGLLTPKHESARLGAGAMRSSAGTLARLPVCRATNLSMALDACRERGLPVYGAAGAASAGTGGADGAGGVIEPRNVFTASFDFPCALVLGGEDKGLRPGVAKRCDAFVAIPMARGLDSLNVAQAGAIILGRMASLRSQS